MKMTDTIQNPFFLTDTALPTTTVSNPFSRASRQNAKPADRSEGLFDIHDVKGGASEIICRVSLGLGLGFALWQCLLTFAAS